MGTRRRLFQEGAVQQLDAQAGHEQQKKINEKYIKHMQVNLGHPSKQLMLRIFREAKAPQAVLC